MAITTEAIQIEFGEVGERFMPLVPKTSEPSSVPWVEIPPSPPSFTPVCAGEADTVMAAPVRKTGASQRPLKVRILPPAPDFEWAPTCLFVYKFDVIGLTCIQMFTVQEIAQSV